MRKDNTVLRDVTNDIFGTKNEPTKAPVQAGVVKKSVLSVAGTKHVSDLGDLVNVPVSLTPVPTSLVTSGVVSVETTESLKRLDKLFRNQTKDFVAIGFELFQLQQTKRYKELGFATFDDFISGEMKLSKSAAYNYINVCCKYSVRDENNKPTAALGKEFTRYSSSQLVVMLSLDKDKIVSVDPDSTVKEIKKLTAKGKSLLADGSDLFDDSNGEKGSGDSSGNSIPKKKNTRDMTVPVNRLSMASGLRWEDVITDKIKNVCLSYLSDERRAADGKEYKIEICITYPDTDSM